MYNHLKKIVVLVVILLFLSALFQSRIEIRDLLFGFLRPALPEPVTYEQTQEVVNTIVDKASETTQNQKISVEPTQEQINKVIKSIQERSEFSNQGDSVIAEEEQTHIIPSEYNLAIPFQPQAPHANWELPYQEACEETSLIMADRYFKNQTLSADEADKEIHKLVLWQKENFGYYEDTKSVEVARMAQEYFGFDVELDYRVTIDNIKKQLSQNKVIIVPVSGQELRNPYFTGLGPIYHMLVIRGYTESKFITNDPGTKRGKEFLYDYNVLINAIHDWPNETGSDRNSISPELMNTGTKVLIVLTK